MIILFCDLGQRLVSQQYSNTGTTWYVWWSTLFIVRVWNVYRTFNHSCKYSFRLYCEAAVTPAREMFLAKNGALFTRSCRSELTCTIRLVTVSQLILNLSSQTHMVVWSEGNYAWAVKLELFHSNCLRLPRSHDSCLAFRRPRGVPRGEKVIDTIALPSALTQRWAFGGEK